MIGLALASVLDTTGASASSGSRRCAWLTLTCTSLNATSTFLSSLKLMRTVERPAREVDSM